MLLRLSLVIYVLTTSTAFAGTYNYRSVLPGERANGMAGAYTALANTSEGAYYNPAGLAFLEHNVISVSGNVYSLTTGERQDGITLFGRTEDLPQDSFTSVPQIASMARRFHFPWEDKMDAEGEALPAKNALAISVLVLEKIDLKGRVDFDLGNGDALFDRAFEDQTLLVGPSYARRLSERLAIGVTLYYMLRELDSFSSIVQESPTNFTLGTTHISQSVGNLLGIFGLRYSPLTNLWLGLTYQMPTIRLHTSGFVLAAVTAEDVLTGDTAHVVVDDPDLKAHAELPQQLNFGVAYEVGKRWTISGDLLWHLPNHFQLFDGNYATVEQSGTVNFSVGGEYYLNDMIVLRSGLFTDRSSSSDLSAGLLEQLDAIDFLGFTAMASLERQNTTVSLGFNGAFGEGEGLDNNGASVPVERTNLALVLAGSYRL